MCSLKQGELQQVPLTRGDVRAHLPMTINQAQPNEHVASVVFLDTETMGDYVARDRIIELGMARCTFSQDRKIILSVDRIYDRLQDPHKPIPPFIKKFTGITDKMVRGKHLSTNEVKRFLVNTSLVVAHKASFDQPRFNRRFPMLNNLKWACSLCGIDWSALGFEKPGLENLVRASGFFYNAHRACEDCLALCFLMIHHQKAFKMLLDSVEAAKTQQTETEIDPEFPTMNLNFD